MPNPDDEAIDIIEEEELDLDDDDAHKSKTIPRANVEVSPPNDFDPGIAEASARPHSSLSMRSTGSNWSSGKRSRAPPAPSSSSGGLQSRRASSCCADKKSKFSCSGWCQGVWEDPKKRRQMIMWIGFALMIFFTILLVTIVIARFSSGFAKSTHKKYGGDEGSVQYVNIARDRYQGPRDLGKELALILIGGKDEEKMDSVEVLTNSGACHMVEGYPSILPAGRTGHTAVSLQNNSLIVCGGLDASSGALSRKCWQYTKGSNKWTQVPGLRRAVRYASGASDGDKALVMGGTDSAGEKVNEVQIFDTTTYIWSKGPDMAQAVWGHCVASPSPGQMVTTGGWADRAIRTSMKNAFALDVQEKGSQPVVIVAGGMDYYHTPLTSVEFLLMSDTTPRWIKMGQLKQARAWYPAVGVLRNRLIVAAGKGFDEQAEDTYEKYSPSKKQWRLAPNHLQWRREDGRSVLVPGNWFPNCMIT